MSWASAAIVWSAISSAKPRVPLALEALLYENTRVAHEQATKFVLVPECPESQENN